MPGHIMSAALYGIDARPIHIEVDVTPGLPHVTIVGLPDTAVQEARERIRSAIKNSGANFPLSRVTISLSPAEWRKEGSGFDMPIAVALLVATGQLPPIFDDCLMVGELNLSGKVCRTNGVVAIADLAQRLGRTLLVPQENAGEAALIRGARVISVADLRQLVTQQISFSSVTEVSPVSIRPHPTTWRTWPMIEGQASAKRAMIIAATGGHNVLMVGPPGSGKTMLARGLQELLPPVTETEALMITRIHSVAGQLRPGQAMMQDRPFRQPHHTASVAALVGGGRVPRPGELSLAHHGVLFLDEFAEFSREHIEALRQPLEDGIVTVSRVAGTSQFPAAGMLVAAMNPCPCGYLHDRRRVCRCTPSQLRRYIQRVSGPILDRFDIFVMVPRVPVQDLTGNVTTDPRPIIAHARQQQIDRSGDVRKTNSQLRPADIREVCKLGVDERAFINQALERFHLSMRAYHRVLRVSRTIADLEASTKITVAHIAEALQYRPPLELGERL